MIYDMDNGAMTTHNYAGEICGVAARSLGLLDAIDRTVALLETDNVMIRSITAQAEKTRCALLERGEPSAVVDPDGRIADSLKRVAEAITKDYNLAIECRESARCDKDLSPDDGVVDAFSEHIAALADFHNAVEDLRDTMETLDSLRSPSAGKTYTDIDKLFADL